MSYVIQSTKAKIIYLILAAILAVISVFIVVQKLNNSVSISYNTKSYSPAMSYYEGIKITAHPKSISNKNLIYSWTTEQGSLLDSNHMEHKNIEYSDDSPVLWNPVENNSVIKIKDKFKIHLKIVDKDNGKILYTKNMTITPDKHEFYTIK